MQDRSHKLRWTAGVYAAIIDFPFGTDDPRAADRAFSRPFDLLSSTRVGAVIDDFYNFWNNVAASFDLHVVVDPDPEATDFVHIVERCIPHSCSADESRRQFRHRSQLSCASDLPTNVFQ